MPGGSLSRWRPRQPRQPRSPLEILIRSWQRRLSIFIDDPCPRLRFAPSNSSLGAIHKRRRNILGWGGGSQISMLQDIRRWGLGKSGLEFRHGGGGYQKLTKKFRRLLWTAQYYKLTHILYKPFINS